MQDGHAGALKKKMVVVVAPCRTDIVTDLHYKMVVIVAGQILYD